MGNGASFPHLIVEMICLILHLTQYCSAVSQDLAFMLGVEGKVPGLAWAYIEPWSPGQTVGI